MAAKTKTKPKEPKSARLADAQAEIAYQFNDLSFENPKLTFEVSLKALGKKLFGRSLSAKQFERECRRAFD